MVFLLSFFLFSFCSFSCFSFSFSIFFFSFFFSSLISLYLHMGGSRKPWILFFFFFFSFFGVASVGLMISILGMQPEGNTLFLLAMLRGINVVATLVEASDRMLPRRIVSAQHVVSMDSAEWIVGMMCDTEPLLWHTDPSSSFLFGCFTTSSGTASRLFPTSGGLLGQSGRHPVEIRGLWTLVVMRTMWSKTPLSCGSRGILNPNEFFIRWVIFSVALFSAVALATFSLSSGHSGT